MLPKSSTAVPELFDDPRIDVGGPSVNPVTRDLPHKMIETRVPMIDVFNCLVESQKIPIFSVAGEPFNQLLARVGIQASADIIIFGGLGLIFDDYHYFRTTFENEGVFSRTVMFVNQASDPIVERLFIPDMCLKVAERFAVEQSKRVLVLMTDMTAYADALKEIGIAMERVPSNRGYMGDLYSQLALRYERACGYKGAGSVTILTVTTMPGNDLTHPVPDNTGIYHRGTVLSARRNARSVRFPFAAKTTGRRQGDARRSRSDHEHHDSFLLFRQRCGNKAGHGVRSVAVRPEDPEVQGLVCPAVYGHQRVDGAQRRVGLVLADARRVFRAGRVADEAGPGGQILRAGEAASGKGMSKVAINKSSLAHQRNQLRLFQRFLPSLDLKRQQLLTEQKKAQQQLALAETEIEELTRSLAGLMEPLGAYEIDLFGLVTIDSVVIEEENVVGARLPVAREVRFKTAPYSMLAKPFWVDFLIEYLQRMCTMRVHLQVRCERVARLNQQVRRITQRVNLFEKVLIPRAAESIKRIQIGLGEQERSAVVRSKIAKKKHAVTL